MKDQYESVYKPMYVHPQIELPPNHSRCTLFYRRMLNKGASKANEIALLNSEINELKIANNELESFSGSIAHDLRAPLRVIGGYAAAISEDYTHVLDVEGKRQLEIIQQNVSLMTALIEGMLNFSRIGKEQINKTEIDMNELMAQTLLRINRVERHNANVVVHPLHPVIADRVLIVQVATNLLHNAIKYSSKSVAPEINIRSAIKNEEVIYSVADNGAGFNMKYKDKLFSMFQRLHGSKEFEGTGVGLALAKRIIEKHGGKIWAEAEERAGATFYFSLPRP